MTNAKGTLAKVKSIFSETSKRKKTVMAVSIAAIMIISSFGAITYLFEQKPSYYNPNIDLNVKFISNNSVSYNVYSTQNPFFLMHTPFNTYNMSNITVNIYGSMPSFENMGSQSVNVTGSATNNSVYSQVFNSTHASSNGYIHGTLNNAFHRIINEYRKIYSSPQEKTISISLTMQADYQFIYQGKMYVYTYYNNIPLNPWSDNFGNSRYSPYTFSSMIYIDMQKQPIVTPVYTSNALIYKAHPDRQIGGGGSPPKCNNVVHTHVYQYWGPLPILMGNIPLNSSSSLAYAYSILNGKYQVSFSSSQVTASSNQKMYTQLSSSGNSAWSDSAANFMYTGTGSYIPAVSIPSYLENISMIGYGHFEYQMVVTTTTYLFVDGSYCAYGSTATSAVLKLINGNNGTFDFEEGYLVNLFNVPQSNASQFMNYNWKQFFNAGLSQDHSYNLPAGSYKDVINISFLANNFQTAASKAVSADNNLALVWAGVSLALSIAAIIAVPLTGGASLLVLTFTASGLILAGASLGAGISASTIESQNPTMEISTAENTITTVGLTNSANPFDNSNMLIDLYQGGLPVTQYINGTPYTYNIQSPYIYAYT
jgi:hypothetical protein